MIAPDVNDEMRPNSTVAPHRSEVYPAPSDVSPKIVPRTEPNPIKLPSMQKNATRINLKFLICKAVFKFEQKSTFFASYIATILGGY